LAGCGGGIVRGEVHPKKGEERSNRIRSFSFRTDVLGPKKKGPPVLEKNSEKGFGGNFKY